MTPVPQLSLWIVSGPPTVVIEARVTTAAADADTAMAAVTPTARTAGQERRPVSSFHDPYPSWYRMPLGVAEVARKPHLLTCPVNRATHFALLAPHTGCEI